MKTSDPSSHLQLKTGVLVVVGVGFGIFFFFLASAVDSSSSSPSWQVTPLGLSLRVSSLHPFGMPPAMEQAGVLHEIGLAARSEIKACIAGESAAPDEVELVFDDGIVSLGSGPVSQETEYGRCVAQVLEGLWGEVPGQHRLVLHLSLP